jgi:hypothetical protein
MVTCDLVLNLAFMPISALAPRAACDVSIVCFQPAQMFFSEFTSLGFQALQISTRRQS